MKVQEAQIVKLHLADNQLWCADGLASPIEVPDRSGFVRELSMKEHVHLRVMGTRENAPLICQLYEQLCGPCRTGKLEVASPAVCLTEQERKDPSIALYRMRQYHLPASLGGWHTVSELDYPSYAITTQLDRDGVVTDHTRKLLLTHPVYHDMMFLPRFDSDALINLIANIRDPRWYIDLDHPYRISRLKSYLGLSPRYIRQMLVGKVTDIKTIRCQQVFHCWHGRVNHLPDNTNNFLWKPWINSQGTWKAALATCHKFLIFFTKTWHQQLAQAYFRTHELDIFTPASLLLRHELPLYEKHVTLRLP